MRNPHSQALSLTASSVVSSFSLLCLVSLRICAILWTSELLASFICMLLDFDTFRGVDHLGVFLLFLKKVADINAAKLSIIFHKLIHLGSFPECWQSSNVTAIPKGATSHDRENYRPISVTPILSKVYEKLVSDKLSSFCEKYCLWPAAQFAYRKGLGW